MTERVEIYCTKCRGKRMCEAEKVDWDKEKAVIHAYKGHCPDCGTKCMRLLGRTSKGLPRTPGKVNDKKYRDRKRQREYYDVIENLPKIKGGLIDPDRIF